MVESKSQSHWLIFWLIAILLHLAVLPLSRLGTYDQKRAPVELIQIDPQKLQSIKNQWKRDRQLLINQNRNRSDVAPKDARYMSENNQVVDRETRARVTDVIPRPQPANEQTVKQEAQSKPRPKLSALGIPVKFSGSQSQASQERRDRSQESLRGADQAILDSNLPEGAENQLNAVESVYYSFYSRLYDSIGPIWQSKIRNVGFFRRVPEGDYITVSEVIIDQEGNLVDVVQLQSSSIAEFDEIVPESWKKIERFPNPPRGLVGPDGRVHMVWRFLVNVGPQSIRYMPPERVE